MKRLCRLVAPPVAALAAAVVILLAWSDAHAHEYSAGFELRAAHSGKCMDVQGGGTQSGAKIIQYQCHGDPNQQTEIIHQTDGYHSLKFLHSGLCLASPNSSNGAQLEQRSCTSSSSQRFTLIDISAASGQMQIKSNGKCVDVQGGSYGNSAPIVQVTCSIYSSSQLWAIRDAALLCCRLINGPFGRQFYFVPTNPSWYADRVDDAVASWNSTGTVSFQETGNYNESEADFYVLDAGDIGWYGLTAFWKTGGQPAQPCDWDEACPPNQNWNYASVIINEYGTGPSEDEEWSQHIAAHEFGHVLGISHADFVDNIMHFPVSYPYNFFEVYTPQYNDVFNADIAY